MSVPLHSAKNFGKSQNEPELVYPRLNLDLEILKYDFPFENQLCIENES